MMNINIHELDAKTIAEQIKGGKEITLEDQGVPVAKIVPISESGRVKKPPTPGIMPGIKMSDDFDDFDDELAKMFGMDE